ncbi:Ribosome biogenesis protein tsr1 [Penicillium argentinense]|uniref:Ribosome biogenesis protein tsr1 n=1 Tax=Penicillium argentinense TaxID=1131581 RepID=A0A9W9EXL8_9EURO|nr:Ribosome biogenesis protein tsr1 [Penicillium argentinense]KAJ5089741.1 Ribosome biogenesis protein tsr1 [Penicillium argentinense]
MAPTQVHHHRSTTKVSHKPFKSGKHASKSALKDQAKGKIENERGTRKTPHQQLKSKLDRRNTARQRQQLKHQEKAQATSIFSGQNGAPRHVAVVPLSVDIDVIAAVRALNESVDVSAEIFAEGASRVRIDRFKQSLLYVPSKHDLLNALDVCRLADFVVLVLSSEVEVEEEGELLLRSIESQGISNVLAVVQGLDKINPTKKRPQVASSLKSYINHFFPTVEKVMSLDSRQECSNAIRSLCTATPKGIRWRDERSWMFIENVQWPDASSEVVDDVVVTGVVRGHGLKADRIAHIPGWGDFQVDSITAAPLPSAKNKRDDAMAVDTNETTQTLDAPTADQDDMATVAPEEIEMEDDDVVSMADTERKGVLLDDHHYFSDDDSHIPAKPKRLPKGTSEYQSAWYLEDVSDSGSDLEDEDGDQDMEIDTGGAPEDGVFPDNQDAMTEGGPSEYPQSEMFLDPSPDDEAQQLAEYRASRRTEAEDDLEFPDEIELHPNVLARERLARFRGLKNLKISNWETSEDRPFEPEDWRRLLQFGDYKGTKNRIIREALAGGVNPGVRVDVHLHAVPSSLRHKAQPAALFSLLRHEHKHTVVNVNMTLSSSVEKPLKSKEELVIQVGARRMVVKPIFSSADNTPNNVHKFDRFLHPGRSAIASWIGPMTWGAVPILVFKGKQTEADPEVLDSADANPLALDRLELVGTGTVVAPDPSRVVAKRAILTGHPYKIHKKVVTVRYMFFNAEDVNWFKALQLWTRRGRSGYIKESLGTHGYFKATFDAKINPQDSVGISLYKRVFPRPARALEQIEA